MKAKSIVLIVLLLLAVVSSTVIYAETVNVGDSSFTLPEGFTVNETDNHQVVLENGSSVIVVYQGDNVNAEDAKQKRIKDGYTLTGEKTYDAGNIEINQQNYNKYSVNAYVYTFTKKDKNYVIVLTLSEGDIIPEKENNPINEIVHSLN